MERRIRKIYKQSEHEIAKNWNSFMEIQGLRVKSLQDEYYRLKNAGRTDEAKTVAIELSKRKKEMTLGNEHFKRMAEHTANELSRTNAIALAYVNGQIPEIYRINYNAVAGTIKEFGGMSFQLINQDTLKYMITKNPTLIPQKTLNRHKDIRWNMKRINSSVLQGIIQGESMDEIAERLLPIMNNNAASAIRNARTLVTSAENKGKLDSFEQLEADGAVLKKVWIATGDDRTRDWHLDMDGQEVDIDEDFVDGLGNEIAYPGDPKGEPETIYNCRCAMRANIIGFRKADGRVEKITREERNGTHQFEIKEERMRRRYG